MNKITTKQVAQWLNQNKDKLCVTHRTDDDPSRVKMLVLGIREIKYVDDLKAVLVVTQHIGPNVIEISEQK